MNGRLFAALDFETTGYARGGGNEPWQLGVALMDGDGSVKSCREWFFRSDAKPDAPSFMDQWHEFHPLLSGRVLVAHNISTERTVLTRAAPLTRWGPWIDTLKKAKAKYPGLPSYALCDLCALFGIAPVLENRTWHDALYDAVACAALAVKLKAL